MSATPATLPCFGRHPLGKAFDPVFISEDYRRPVVAFADHDFFGNEANPNSRPVAQTQSVHCLETREMPAVFSRRQATREQAGAGGAGGFIADQAGAKNDATTVEFRFVSDRAMITGRNLAEIYQTAAATPRRRDRKDSASGVSSEPYERAVHTHSSS